MKIQEAHVVEMNPGELGLLIFTEHGWYALTKKENWSQKDWVQVSSQYAWSLIESGATIAPTAYMDPPHPAPAPPIDPPSPEPIDPEPFVAGYRHGLNKIRTWCDISLKAGPNRAMLALYNHIGHLIDNLK